MRTPRFLPILLILLASASIAAAEPRVIGRTESNVKVLRGSGSAVDSAGTMIPGMSMPTGLVPPAPAPVAAGGGAPEDPVLAGPPPNRTTPEALALARRLVSAFGGKVGLKAWLEGGERRGSQTVHMPTELTATFVERRGPDRVRMDIETSGMSMSVADTPEGGWQRFLGLVSDLPDAQKAELASARAHDEGLLLLAAAGAAPAAIHPGDGRDALVVWGPSGSATMFVPGDNVPLSALKFRDRAALREGEVSQSLTFSDWRTLAPQAAGMSGPAGTRVPFAAKHFIEGQLVEEDALTSVDLLAAFDDTVFTRPGVSERTIGPSSRAVLALTRKGEHHFAQISVNGAAPRTFLIDTGAGITAISRELADTLGLALGDPLSIVGLGGGVEARSANLQSVGFGTIERKDVTCLVLDFAEMRTNMGLDVEGILGFSALNRYAVTFDFAAGTLEVAQNAGRRAPKAGGARVPMQMLGGQALVDGKVDGVDAGSFILDTGSWITFVPRSVARKVHSLKRVPGISFVGADGRLLEAEAVRARSISIGGARVDRPILLSASGGGANDPVGLTLASGDRGVLGANVLRRFRITLDYPRGEMVLDPAPGSGPDVEEGLSMFGLVGPGIVLEAGAKGLVARTVVAESPAERAGIRAGDRVLAVDAQSLDGAPAGAAQGLLSGPEGSSVSVKVRGASGAERTVKLQRVKLL